MKIIGCIIVELVNSPRKKLDDLFSPMIRDDQIETHVYENGSILMYIHEVEKVKLWQVVLNLESEQIPVGFGFGKQKEIAKQEAIDRLKLVYKMNIH